MFVRDRETQPWHVVPLAHLPKDPETLTTCRIMPKARRWHFEREAIADDQPTCANCRGETNG